MPTQRNIEIWRGSDPLEIWRAYDASGNPVDFTGYTLNLIVKDRSGNTIISNFLKFNASMPARAIARANEVWGSTVGCIAFEMTRTQSLLIEVGANSKYWIEPEINSIKDAPMFYGVITGKSGVE